MNSKTNSTVANNLPIYDDSNQVWNFGVKNFDTSETDDVFIEGVLYYLNDVEKAKLPDGTDADSLLKLQFATDAETKSGKSNHYLVINNSNNTELMPASDTVDGKVKSVARLKAEGKLYVESRDGGYAEMSIAAFKIEPGTGEDDPRLDPASPGTMRTTGQNLAWPDKCR